MMSIQFFILYLVGKCMIEAHANIYLVETIDGKLNDTGVVVEKNNKGEDYHWRGRHPQGKGSRFGSGWRGRGHKGRPGGAGWRGRGHKGRPGGAFRPVWSGVKGFQGRGHKGRPGGAGRPGWSGIKVWRGRGHKGRPSGGGIPSWSGVKECTCTDFISDNGYGQCKKGEKEFFGGSPICYVKQPSSCNDLKPSKTNQGMVMSALACHTYECTCTDFISDNGYGQCKKGEKEFFGGSPICYVKQPSSCNDLKPSKTNQGMVMSALACGRGIGLNPIENGINGLTPVLGVPAGSGGTGGSVLGVPAGSGGAGGSGDSGSGITNAPITATVPPTTTVPNIPGSGSGAVADGGSGDGSGSGITNAPIAASVPPTTTVPSNEGSGCGSQNTVKNVESLSPVERTNLLEAMRKLKVSPAWGSVASIHGGAPEYTICDNGVIKEHGGFACCVHGGNSFLAWHRFYLDRMNRDLRKHDPTAVIPYWDWTVTPFPSIAESSQSSFFSGPVTVPTTRRPETITSRNVDNAVLSNSIGLQQRVLEILTEQRYQDFENQLEGIHNEIHVAIGQHMSDLDLASFDPIFYLHHTFIDYIWAIWQVLRPNERPQPAELSRIMNPFGKIASEALECKNYNIDENGDSIVFGGKTFSQIKCQVCASDQNDCDSICGSDFSDTYAPEITTTIYNSKIYSVPKKKKKKKRNKIYAGFFTRDFGISGHIKFNICKSESVGKENCTIPGGEFSTFGGSKERKYNSTFPTKIDVTDAVINAGMNETEMCRFEITSFVDFDGNDLGKQLTRWFQPITIFRPKDSQNDVYSFTFKGKRTQAPNVDIPKECTFQIESDGNIVDEDQKCIPVPNGYISEPKSYIQWQDENHEKYNKWNKPGKHTFNDIRCEAENGGSTITIIKH